MEIIYFDEIKSTQLYLKEQILKGDIKKPILVYTFNQTNGIGSRDNIWVGERGSLFFSFCVKKQALPNDLPLSSISLYFTYIFKQVLQKNGSKIWLKWPNDLYINKNKVGGCVSAIVKDYILCGIGLNFSNLKFCNIDIDVDKLDLIKQYLRNIENVKKYPKWSEIFSKYKVEFYLSKEFFINLNNKKVSLKNAVLNSDGSLTINNEKVYNAR